MSAAPERRLTTPQFAKLAGISRRRATEVTRECAGGGSWRGHRLQVRAETGHRCQGGIAWFVVLASLPAELRARALALWPGLAAPAASSLPMPVAAESAPNAAPAAPLVRPRKPRANKGTPLCYISRAWDAAMKHVPHGRKAEIRDIMLREARSLWAADLAGARDVANLALIKLMEITRAAGFTGSEEELERICQLPRHFVRRERKKGLAVARYRKDRKAHVDRRRRIRRDYTDLRPGELIIGDVHPVDVLYERDDGSSATMKLIGWLDARSNYFVGLPAPLPPGRGIRMAHVAYSFARLITDEEFMPALLYLDNGKEYGATWTDFAEAAMKLVGTTPLCGINDSATRRVVRSLPYNAQARKIEPIHRVLEQVFRSMQGYIGGNRMAKKTHNVGEVTRPFGDAYATFNEILDRINYANTRRSDALGGARPCDLWAERERLQVDFLELQTTFARRVKRQLKTRTFTLDGATYYHEAIAARPDLDWVWVYAPIFGDKRLIRVHDDDDAFLCHASLDERFAVRDPAGALESARGATIDRAAIRQLQAETDDIDISARMRAFVELNRPLLTAGPTADRITLTGEHGRAAEDLRRLARGKPSLALAAPARTAEDEEAEADAFHDRILENTLRERGAR